MNFFTRVPAVTIPEGNTMLYNKKHKDVDVNEQVRKAAALVELPALLARQDTDSYEMGKFLMEVKKTFALKDRQKNS
jgi:hypothetical protein